MAIKLYTEKSSNDVYSYDLLKKYFTSDEFKYFGNFIASATVRAMDHCAMVVIFEHDGKLLSCNDHPLRQRLTFTHYLPTDANIDECLMDSAKSLQRLLEIL